VVSIAALRQAFGRKDIKDVFKGGFMTKEEKLERISAFESGYSLVDELIAGIGKEELLFVPALRDAMGRGRKRLGQAGAHGRV